MDLGVLPGKERASLLRRAVARATEIRLRSILLTSGTTILGLAPLLIPWDEWLPWLPIPTSSTEGADIWDNLARSSIGGLAASTVLLIVVMPALYAASRLGLRREPPRRCIWPGSQGSACRL